MITSAAVYNSVSAILALASVISIILAFKFIPDKRARNLMIIGLVLILLTSLFMPFCLKIFKLQSIVYSAEAAGKVEKGTLEKIYRFKDLATIGAVMELLAIVLLVGVTKRRIALAIAGQKGEETPS
jgi:hypothetical protein